MDKDKKRAPEVSIVIPVYNVERYLKECMESVLNQTLQNIEIICVDDGSDDGSKSILDEYGAADGKVTVIHKANSGYGSAMNIGIAASSGEYIGIVEPDDYISANMMDALYKCAAENNLDMVSSDHIRFYGSGEGRIFQRYRVADNMSFYNIVLDPYKERKIFEGNFINSAGLFRRGFLEEHNIKYNETPGASYQDIGFCFQVLMYARRIMVLDGSFYYYRQDNPDSSIASKGKMGCIMEECAFLYRIIEADSKRLGTYRPQFLREKLGNYLYTLQRLAPGLRREFLRLIGNEFREFQDRGELDDSVLPDSWRKIMFRVMEDPDKFYEEFMDFRNEIHEKLKAFDSAVIYGAGLIGKRILDEMLEEDRRKVKGFAVTDLTGNPENYRGVMVREIDSYIADCDNIAVLIGIAGKNRDKVLRGLSEKSFSHVIIPESVGLNI